MRDEKCIDIVSNNVEFHLELKRQVIVIHGESGSGKSLLIDYILRANSVVDKRTKLLSDTHVEVIRTVNAINSIIDSNIIYVIDDGVIHELMYAENKKYRLSLATKCRKKNFCFIIISMHSVKFVNYRIKSVLSLSSSIKDNKTIFTLVPTKEVGKC